MHYLFVGYYVGEEIFRQILDDKINNMSVARQKFEYSLIHGLYDQLQDHISFISYVPTNDELKIPDKSFVGDAAVSHIAIQKNRLNSILRARKAFDKYLNNLGEDKLQGLKVIMYAVNPVFESIILKYRKKYSMQLITICSEVPELRRYGNSLGAKAKKHLLSYFNKQFNGYIFFSEAMTEVVKYRNKPYIVLEGIAPEIRKGPSKGKKNIVMYAGGLAHDNNVSLLARYCQCVPELDELWICGAGEDAAEVEYISREDGRIKYFGRLDNNKILELEEQAKLLVNMRSPKVLLARYSFPSKILEYISSGSLVLSTELVGIPHEYFEYIIPLKSMEKNQVIDEITKCLKMDEDLYIKKVESAQAFIRDQKNERVQSKRIVEFVSCLN